MFFDCHNHTEFSHDSTASADDMCRAAIENHLNGIAFTDHCDVEYRDHMDIKTPIVESVKRSRSLSEKYKGRLDVLSGVEISECSWYPDSALDVLSGVPYDIIIGSVHALRFGEITAPYAKIDFSEFSDAQIHDYLEMYFSDIIELIQNTDFDVLAHLTCPLRYIAGKYKRKTELDEFREITDEIFKLIIKKDIALELNSSSYELLDSLMPGRALAERYKELGGRLFTLGSDAHFPDRVGHCLDKGAELLRSLSLKTAFYIKNRTPIEYLL